MAFFQIAVRVAQADSSILLSLAVVFGAAGVKWLLTTR